MNKKIAMIVQKEKFPVIDSQVERFVYLDDKENVVQQENASMVKILYKDGKFETAFPVKTAS